MKKKWFGLIIGGVLCLSLAVAATGCGTVQDSDQDYGDGAEYFDVDYLTGEYADQLVEDGAETVVGSVEFVTSDDGYQVNVIQKKVVVNENYEDGYYIADRNMTTTYTYGSDLGIVVSENGEPTMCDADTFYEKYSGDQDALYTVYLLGDTVELILPLDPEDVVADAQ